MITKKYMSKKTSMEQTNIIITNKKILNYFNKNKHINIENTLLQLIDIFENVNIGLNDDKKLVNDLIRTITEENKTILNSISTHNKIISDNLNINNKDVSNILSQVTILSEISKSEFISLKNMYNISNDTLKKEMEYIKILLTNMSSSLITKIHETKDNYLKELKDMMRSNDMESSINISLLLEKQTVKLLENINIVLNDVIPKSHIKYYDDIITKFRNDVMSSLDKLTNTESKITLDKISLLIETKYNNLIGNIQNELNKSLVQTEDRLTNNITQIKDISFKTENLQENINKELLNYINKYNKSSSKGELSEKILYNLLNKMYPSGEFINTSNETGMGDILLKRDNYKMILFENKNYSVSVRKEEIDKFLKDITKNKCNGIFISQYSGVVGKENFQIDIHDHNILVYIHNCDYDIDKIRMAVNIIDTLSSKLNYMQDADINLSKELLEKINYEYNNFIIKKENMNNLLKDYYKKMTEQMKDITLPNLEIFLSEHYANNKKNILTCEICNIFQDTNLMSLSRHKSSCSKKHNATTTSSTSLALATTPTINKKK
jgi:hypothetical protein